MIKRVELYSDRQKQHKRTWTAAVLVLTLICMSIGAIAFNSMIEICGLRGGIRENSWQEIAFQLIFGFGISAALCLSWIYLFEKRGPDSVGFKGGGLPFYLRGLLSGFVSATSVIAIIYLLGGYEIENSGIFFRFSFTALLPLAILFLGFMIQGGTEELFMRGWLFQILTSRYGVGVGITGNMIVFSLAHAGNINYSTELLIGLFNIVLVAIMLSLYALKEGNLWGVCAWHSIWNWLLGVGFGVEVSGHPLPVIPLLIDLKNTESTPVWLNGGAFGPEASLVTSVILVAGIIYFGKRKPHGQRYRSPD